MRCGVPAPHRRVRSRAEVSQPLLGHCSLAATAPALAWLTLGLCADIRNRALGTVTCGRKQSRSAVHQLPRHGSDEVYGPPASLRQSLGSDSRRAPHAAGPTAAERGLAVDKPLLQLLQLAAAHRTGSASLSIPRAVPRGSPRMRRHAAATRRGAGRSAGSVHPPAVGISPGTRV